MTEKKDFSAEHQKASETLCVRAGLDGLKANLIVTPVFAFLDKFDDFTKKKKKVLASGEILFEPGESPYFYIVSSGALRICRINPSGEKKEIGKAFSGSFIGEWVLSGRFMKEVQAEAYVPSAVVALQKEDFEYLESLSPETLMRFYKHMNNLTSLRLADTGKELALLYEMTEKVNSYKERGEQGLLDGIKLLKKSLSLDYVIAVEQHPAVPGLFAYKFNTRSRSSRPINRKVGSEITVTDDGKIIRNGEIPGVSEDDAIQLLPLASAGELRGFLILGKKTEWAKFSDYEVRIAENLSPLFASMIENNQKIADTKARAMMNPY